LYHTLSLDNQAFFEDQQTLFISKTTSPLQKPFTLKSKTFVTPLNAICISIFGTMLRLPLVQ